MGNSTNMRQGTVQTDPRLRQLLRTSRQSSGNLSQRAAAKRAGISSVYWQKIESGTLPAAPASTLAAMFTATGITSEYLRSAGYPVIADTLDDLAGTARPRISPEDHLATTPGASSEEITVLQAVWLALKAQRTAEPLEQDFEQHNRHNT